MESDLGHGDVDNLLGRSVLICCGHSSAVLVGEESAPPLSLHPGRLALGSTRSKRGWPGCCMRLLIKWSVATFPWPFSIHDVAPAARAPVGVAMRLRQRHPC